MSSDQEKLKEKIWMEELKNGSELAFRQLFNKYSEKVFLLGRKLGMNKEDSEGLVQDVFFKIWKNRQKLKSEFIFEVYLIKIAKSIVFRKFERAKLEREYQSNAFSTANFSENQTEDYIIFEDLLSHSMEEVKNLSPRQKQVFLMKNFENLSLEEIAEKLQLSKRTVENQVFRANQILKKKIQDLNFLTLFF